MYQIVWAYEIRSDRVAQFEAMYGPAGTWAQFFRQGDGYLGTVLYHDHTDSARYLTIDRWTSEAAHDAFVLARSADYAALDDLGGGLTVREERLGTIES